MKNRIKWVDLVPFFIFGLILLVFGVATGGTLFAKNNLMNIINQSIATIIAGLGMIFVISIGGTDISQGSLLAVSAGAAAIATTQFGAVATLPVAAAVGVCSGLFVGFVHTKFKVPSFMITLSLNIALRALVNLIIGSTTYMMDPAVRGLVDSMSFKLITLAIMFIAVTYLFNYTRFGLYAKAVGENENAVRHAGVNVDRIKILAFVMSGLMASIAGIYTVARVGGVNNTIGSSFEMRVMMALFIGGVPVQGGMGSKLYKLLVGAPMITMLESGLVLCGASGSITQGIRGLVLLGAVLLTRIINDRFAVLDLQNAAQAGKPGIGTTPKTTSDKA